MDTGTTIATRKIQLIIDSVDKEYMYEVYQTLYRWRYICFRSANYIFTHLYIQEQIKDLFYFTDNVKVRLADIKKDENGILTCSRMGTTQKLLSSYFKNEIPSHILNSLNNTLIQLFNKEKKAYFLGERSLRNYKRDIPIPFLPEDLRRFNLTTDGNNFQFNLFKIPFRTCLGRDTDKRQLLRQLLEGKIKLCTSYLTIEQKNIYLLASLQRPCNPSALDASVIAEASLSLDYPIIVIIGKARHTIGSKEEFLHRRLAIQAARQRIRQGVSYNKAQHGKSRKFKPLHHYKTKENDYIDYKTHLYSRKLIDLCIKYRAATLILVNQKNKEEAAKADAFLLRNWSYYTLKEKILYKAAMAGIEVIIE